MQEVVTLCSPISCSPAQLSQAAAPHALPHEFHRIIARAEQHTEKETVLLDVRNYYETRIGCFQKVHSPLQDPLSTLLPTFHQALHASLGMGCDLVYSVNPPLRFSSCYGHCLTD